MEVHRRAKIVGIGLILLGGLLCSLMILAAFTPIGLIALPVGLVAIVFGALRVDRANRQRS